MIIDGIKVSCSAGNLLLLLLVLKDMKIYYQADK